MSRAPSREPYQTRATSRAASRHTSREPSLVRPEGPTSTSIPGALPDTSMEQDSSPTVTPGAAEHEVELQDVVNVINSLIGAIGERFDGIEAKMSDLNTTIGTIKRDVRRVANEVGERSTDKETTVHKKLNVLYEQIELGKSTQERQRETERNEAEKMGKNLRGIQEQYEALQAQNTRLEKGFYDSIDKAAAVIRDLERKSKTAAVTTVPITSTPATPAGAPEIPTQGHARIFRIHSPSPDRISERTEDEDRGRTEQQKKIGSLFDTPSRARVQPTHEKVKPRTSIAASAANTTMATITTDTAKAIMKKPAEYEGKRGLMARSFITKMETYFRTRDSQWGDEEKIYATLTNIGGTNTALAWALPLLENYNNGVDHPYLENWGAFKEAFLLNFDDPTYAMRANEELMSIQQTSTVHEYATHFRSLTAQVSWDKNALVAAFKKGLKPAIKQELLRATLFDDESTANVEQWIALALRVESVNWRPQGAAGMNTSRPERDVKGRTDSRRDGVFVPNETKDLRRKEGRCLKCGKRNHVMADCHGEWQLDYKDQKKEFKKEKGKMGEVMEEKGEDEAPSELESGKD